MDPIVLALLRERQGYVARGLQDRVAAVDEELRRLGYDPDDGSDAHVETATRQRRSRR